jgi:aspartate/tyrosine/aromatic aminotransferase
MVILSEYLALGGLKSFTQLSAQLVLGDETGASPALSASRVHSIQCLGGTGGLRLGVEFLKRLLPGAAVFLPNSTWPTHLNLMRHAGLAFQTYRYLAPSGLALDFPGLLEDLGQCPEGSIVLLHMVAHNPSGFDPSPEQWQQVLEVVQRRRLFPLMDNAYQGFFRGLQEDAYAARLFAAAGVEMLLACSFSKNFGLYGERVGCLHVLSADASAGTAILSHLTALSRTLHSNCPSYGARVVATILGDEELRAQWQGECAGMAGRLNAMRKQMHALLLEHNTPGEEGGRATCSHFYLIANILLCCCLLYPISRMTEQNNLSHATVNIRHINDQLWHMTSTTHRP